MSTTTTTTTTTTTKPAQVTKSTGTSDNVLQVKLKHIKPGFEAPAYHTLSPAPGEKQTNVEYGEYPCEIHDIRGHEAEYSLHNNGFQYAKWATTEEMITLLRDNSPEARKQVVEKYYPEVEAFLKRVTGAKRVACYEHLVRQRREGGANNPMAYLTQPAPHVHIDHGPESARARVIQSFPEEGPELIKNRFMIVNVWRPLIEPICDWPLAVCDYKSLDVPRDIVEFEIRIPDNSKPTDDMVTTKVLNKVRNRLLMGDPSHKWFHMSGQKKDEVVCLKCYDSHSSEYGAAEYTPHGSFDNPAAPKGAPLRESVEARAMLFF